MRNATLSLLWLLLGTGVVASTAAAQSDETEEPAAQGEGTPGAAEGDAEPPAVEEAGAEPTEAGTEPETEPEATTPAGTAASALDAPSNELDEGDLDEAGADAEGAEEEAEEAPPPPQLPWRNSFFSWSNTVTFNSFWRGAQLSYNPYYAQSFSLTPRWYVGPQSFFLLSQSLGVELTDVDGGALNRDPQLTDTVIEFRHLIPWEGFIFQPAVRVTLPLSKASQAAQRYVQGGLGLTVTRVIPEINLTLAGSFAYRSWLAGSNVVHTQDHVPADCESAAGPIAAQGVGEPVGLDAPLCDQVGGATASRDMMVTGLTGILTFDNLSITAQFLFIMLYGYELAPAYIHVATSPEPVMIADGSPSHWRNFTYFTIVVGYQFTPWLNVSLGIQNHPVYASAYNPDGSIRNPIFTPDTSAYLTASFQLDTIYTELAGRGDSGLTPEELQRRRQGLAGAPSAGGTF
ncbi:MAG TPA: hypothetical protein VIL20_06035 [Sandaracinaceae bacterium]